MHTITGERRAEEAKGRAEAKKEGGYFGCGIMFQVFVQSIYDFWQRPLRPVQLQAIMSSSQCSECALFPEFMCVSTACFMFYWSVDLGN